MKLINANDDLRTYLKFLDKFRGGGSADNDVSLRRHNETLVNCFVYEGQQWIVVTFHI